MPDTINTKDVVSGIGVPRHQIETWVSRGYLKPTHEAKGRAGREWTFDDVFGIAVLNIASEMGLSLQVFREVAEFGAPKIPGFQTHLIVTYGDLVKIIPDTMDLSKAEAEQKASEAQSHRFPAHVGRWDFVGQSALLERLSSAPFEGAIVIPLSPLEEKLKALFSCEDG